VPTPFSQFSAIIRTSMNEMSIYLNSFHCVFCDDRRTIVPGWLREVKAAPGHVVDDDIDALDTKDSREGAG